jgi:hypothetical protein
MADVTWLSASSVEETIAQLDALHRPLQTERLRFLDAQKATVSRLGESSQPWPEEEAFNPQSGMKGYASPVPQPTPFVPLPERTTHGGPFGPKVRAKLIAEALERR